MAKRPIGGIIHTYQRYDPKTFPSPTQPPPDLVSGAMEHMLAYGSMRELTDEELARAVQLDPSQIAGLGPSLEALMELLRERKRKILETYETKRVKKEAASRFHDMAKSMQPPREVGRAVPPGGQGRAALRHRAALVPRRRRAGPASPGNSCS